jgi:hypothetical protein
MNEQMKCTIILAVAILIAGFLIGGIYEPAGNAGYSMNKFTGTWIVGVAPSTPQKSESK